MTQGNFDHIQHAAKGLSFNSMLNHIVNNLRILEEHLFQIQTYDIMLSIKMYSNKIYVYMYIMMTKNIQTYVRRMLHCPYVMISMFSPGFEVVKLGRYWLSKTYTIRRIERRCRRVKLSNLLKNYNATNK